MTATTGLSENHGSNPTDKALVEHVEAISATSSSSMTLQDHEHGERIDCNRCSVYEAPQLDLDYVDKKIRKHRQSQRHQRWMQWIKSNTGILGCIFGVLLAIIVGAVFLSGKLGSGKPGTPENEANPAQGRLEKRSPWDFLGSGFGKADDGEALDSKHAWPWNREDYWTSGESLASETLYRPLIDNSHPEKVFTKRADLDSVPKNPYITRWAAIGDSYSGGIGAGTQIDARCSRYSDSYPMQLSRTDLFSERFQFLACAGERMSDIMNQVQEIQESQQLITISAGGNDMDLLKIANACLMHFNLFDLPDCQETLLAVHDHASSDAFRRDIETLLKRALDKLDPDGRIIWTGYVTMFNLDDDGFCDTQTWSLWKKLNTHPFGFAPPPAPLSIHLRGQLNHLVTLCNSVINDVIKKHGDGRTVFLTYEEDFRGGRFCEKDPRPEGLYFFSPCVNHKDSDKFPLHYNDIVESVSGTSAHDLYHGVELMRSAHPQLLTDSIDTCPCGGSGQACKDVEDSADMALPVAAAAAAAVATSTPGAQTNSSSNMLKRSQLITSHHTAIAKLVDIFTCALHLTSSGNSIIARHVYQEAFIWIAAKKLAERAPTFQNSVICTSDLATWHGELVDIELFRNVASEFCSQPAMDAVGRQDWDRKQLQQLTVRKNVVQDGQETEWDVVADVSLVTTIGPKSKILAIEKERERLGLSSKKGQRIIPWNITTSHCEDMMNGILRTCDTDRELHLPPGHGLTAGGSMIDGAATWRLSIQPTIPRLPEVKATENSTSDLTEVETSQGVVRVETPLSQLRRLLCFWLQFPWREVGWCNSRFMTGPKVLGHSRDPNRPTPQLTVEKDAIPCTVSAEALPNPQEKALNLWNWLKSKRVFWGASASPDLSPSARPKTCNLQPLTHGALHQKITSLRIRAKLKQQQLRAYTTLSVAIDPEILQLQIQKGFKNLLDQILGRWDELDEAVQQEVKDLYHRLFKVEKNLVPGLDSVDDKGERDEEEYWRDVVLHEDNGLLRDELVELWLIENVFLDDEWRFEEKEQEEDKLARVRVEL